MWTLHIKASFVRKFVLCGLNGDSTTDGIPEGTCDSDLLAAIHGTVLAWCLSYIPRDWSPVSLGTGSVVPPEPVWAHWSWMRAQG